MSATENERYAFQHQFRSNEHDPDFTIRIEDYEWLVRSRIVSEKSDFFKRVCAGPFKETAERRVTLHDDEPIMVARMIQFMYCNQYTGVDVELSAGPVPSLSEMLRHEKTLDPHIISCKSSEDSDQIDPLMYLIGDKYDIKGLCTLARTRIEEAVRNAEGAKIIKTINYLGVGVWQRDAQLCRSTLRSVARPDTSIATRYEEVKPVLVNSLYASKVMIECLVEAAQSKAKATKAADEDGGNETTQDLRSIDDVMAAAAVHKEAIAELTSAVHYVTPIPIVKRRLSAVRTTLGKIEESMASYKKQKTQASVSVRGGRLRSRGSRGTLRGCISSSVARGSPRILGEF